jgi:TatD DNase family protein
MPTWIDTHAHLDATELETWVSKKKWPLAGVNNAQAAIENIAIVVIPAVHAANFEAVRALAHRLSCSYALGIHPLYIRDASEADLALLDRLLTQHQGDPRLVAVGEIGLDFFVTALCQEPLLSRQTFFYKEQLKLARKHALPAILHVRRSADQLLKGLRQIEVCGGIAHAFNGSLQQAQQFVGMGFKLGFGGAATYERATQLRLLARELPPEAMVMETDSPDIPPHWLYTTAAQREAGAAQGINTPDELPRIGQVLAQLRGVSPQEWAAQTTRNALAALPRLKNCL